MAVVVAVMIRRWVQALGDAVGGAFRPEVLYEGFLMKRGTVNTSFKKRWFVLTNTPRLYYYERDIFKGKLAIDLTFRSESLAFVFDP